MPANSPWTLVEREGERKWKIVLKNVTSSHVQV